MTDLREELRLVGAQPDQAGVDTVWLDACIASAPDRIDSAALSELVADSADPIDKAPAP